MSAMNSGSKDRQKRDMKAEKKARKCKMCGVRAGLIRKYGLNICRRCFKEVAEKMGFSKYS